MRRRPRLPRMKPSAFVMVVIMMKKQS